MTGGKDRHFIIMEQRETITEQWKYSEFKDTVVDIYAYYMECFKAWVDGLQGVTAQLPDTRSRFISALTTFYSDQRGFYLPYLQRKVLPFHIDDYDNLVFKRMSNEHLYLLHTYLVTWFNTYGAKALGNEITVFKDAIDSALAELYEHTSKTKEYTKYPTMQPIYNLLDSYLNDNKHGLKKNNQDCFFIVTGKTGAGKSFLLLDIFEAWYTQILQVPDFSDEYIKYFATTNEQHKAGLGELKNKPFCFLAHDEVVRTAKARNWMRGDNKKFADLYNVIRGMNLIHGHAIPDFTELDKTFIKSRIDFVIVITVEKHGRYANFYSRHRCRELYNDCTQNDIPPEHSKVLPNFKCKFDEYKGILLEPYKKQKQIGMHDIVDEYAGENLTHIEKAKLEKGKEIYNLVTGGMGKMEAYKKLNLDSKKGKRYLETYCTKSKKVYPI